MKWCVPPKNQIHLDLPTFNLPAKPKSRSLACTISHCKSLKVRCYDFANALTINLGNCSNIIHGYSSYIQYSYLVFLVPTVFVPTSHPSRLFCSCGCLMLVFGVEAMERAETVEAALKSRFAVKQKIRGKKRDPNKRPGFLRVPPPH